MPQDFHVIEHVLRTRERASRSTLNGAEMRRSLMVLTILVAAGCAREMPPMPQVKSSEGKACVKTCQRDHSACMSACPPTWQASQRCMNMCNEKLDECYSLCTD